MSSRNSEPPGDLRTSWQRFWPVALTTVIIALVFGLLGTVAGPRWSPEPMTTGITPHTSELGIGGTGGTGAAVDEGTYTVTTTSVQLDLADVTVAALLYLPDEAPPGPGVVFMHGAGTGEPEAFAAHGQALASMGIAVLSPAKRLDNYSMRERDYVSMAEDYLVAWNFLRDQVPGVNADQVGFYAESEGAWIAPVAASMESDVAFALLVSAPVVTPRQQAAYATDNYLRNTHVPSGVFRAIPRALGATIPGGGFDYVDFDVDPYLDQLDIPVLMAYGTGDASMPIVQGARQTIDRLAAHGNDAVSVRYFHGADHGIRIGEELAPGFTDVLAQWSLGLPDSATAPPQIAGAQPDQEFRAGPVPTPAWYASGDMLVWSIIGSFALVALGLGIGGVNLVKRRVYSAAVGRYAVATGLSAIAVLVTFVAYVAQIADLAMNYRLDDAVVIGGWILVQSLGVFSVTIAVLSMRVARRAKKTGTRFDTTSAISWWSTHAGALLLLLVAAYWGVFPAVG